MSRTFSIVCRCNRVLNVQEAFVDRKFQCPACKRNVPVQDALLDLEEGTPKPQPSSEPLTLSDEGVCPNCALGRPGDESSCPVCGLVVKTPGSTRVGLNQPKNRLQLKSGPSYQDPEETPRPGPLAVASAAPVQAPKQKKSRGPKEVGGPSMVGNLVKLLFGLVVLAILGGAGYYFMIKGPNLEDLGKKMGFGSGVPDEAGAEIPPDPTRAILCSVYRGTYTYEPNVAVRISRNQVVLCGKPKRPLRFVRIESGGKDHYCKMSLLKTEEQARPGGTLELSYYLFDPPEGEPFEPWALLPVSDDLIGTPLAAFQTDDRTPRDGKVTTRDLPEQGESTVLDLTDGPIGSAALIVLNEETRTLYGFSSDQLGGTPQAFVGDFVLPVPVPSEDAKALAATARAKEVQAGRKGTSFALVHIGKELVLGGEKLYVLGEDRRSVEVYIPEENFLVKKFEAPEPLDQIFAHGDFFFGVRLNARAVDVFSGTSGRLLHTIASPIGPDSTFRMLLDEHLLLAEREKNQGLMRMPLHHLTASGEAPVWEWMTPDGLLTRSDGKSWLVMQVEKEGRLARPIPVGLDKDIQSYGYESLIKEPVPSIAFHRRNRSGAMAVVKAGLSPDIKVAEPFQADLQKKVVYFFNRAGSRVNVLPLNLPPAAAELTRTFAVPDVALWSDIWQSPMPAGLAVDDIQWSRETRRVKASNGQFVADCPRPNLQSARVRAMFQLNNETYLWDQPILFGIPVDPDQPFIRRAAFPYTALDRDSRVVAYAGGDGSFHVMTPDGGYERQAAAGRVWATTAGDDFVAFIHQGVLKIHPLTAGGKITEVPCGESRLIVARGNTFVLFNKMSFAVAVPRGGGHVLSPFRPLTLPGKKPLKSPVVPVSEVHPLARTKEIFVGSGGLYTLDLASATLNPVKLPAPVGAIQNITHGMRGKLLIKSRVPNQGVKVFVHDLATQVMTESEDLGSWWGGDARVPLFGRFAVIKGMYIAAKWDPAKQQLNLALVHPDTFRQKLFFSIPSPEPDFLLGGSEKLDIHVGGSVLHLNLEPVL